jgi:DNA-binding transcriptional LysR family regulator
MNARRPDHVSDRLKLPQLKVLLAVARTGSMSKAAKDLSMSQSVVSKAISELEATLGVRLFDRSVQGVEPTFYGKSLLKRAAVVFDELRTSVGEIEFLANPGVGELRIGSTLPQTPVVAAVIERLSRKYPRLDFKVIFADGVTLLDRHLRGRRIDLMIAPLMSPPLEDDLESTFLYENAPRVVVGPKSPWAGRRNVELIDLIGEPWCLPPPETALGAVFLDAVRSHGLEPPRVVVWSASNQLCHRLLVDGRFVGISTNVTLHFDPHRPHVKELPVELCARTFRIAVLTLKNRTISPIAQIFIDCAREIVRPLVGLGVSSASQNRRIKRAPTRST